LNHGVIGDAFSKSGKGTVIEIDSNSSFLQLHEAIQDAVDFDNDHLFQFYLGRHPDQYAHTIGGEPS
jgi:hypothetical protein